MVYPTALRLLLAVTLITASSPPPAADPPPATDLSTRAGEDWGTFLGPAGSGASSLVGIASPWGAAGPRVVWHAAMAEGYCAPAVAGGRAFLFDRVENRLRLRAVEAETGRPLWEAGRDVVYSDSFGYDGGPRAQPVVSGDRLLTFGPDGKLECRAIVDGSLLWEVDTSATYRVIQNFFGVGAAALVVGPQAVGAEERTLVVVQVGGSRVGASPAAPERLDLVKGLDSGLVAFDLDTGAEVWRATNQLASYSVPVLATIGGRPLILAWMRDDLVAVEPATGKLLDRFRWRSDELFSVVAASPVVSGDQILLSECYGPGSVLLEVEKESFSELRRDRPGARPRQALKTHWNTPVLQNGYVYGSSGRNAGDAQLVCVNWNTGVVGWSEGGLGRASTTLVDGHLLVLGEYGDLVLARATAEKYDELSRVRPVDAASGRELLVAPCWAAPVIARGLLFVRGNGRVVCLDLLPAR